MDTHPFRKTLHGLRSRKKRRGLGYVGYPGGPQAVVLLDVSFRRQARRLYPIQLKVKR